MAEAFQTTATGCGKVTSLSVYLDASSTATKLVAGLYADASGHPGALIAQGSGTSLVAGWNDIPITSATVTQGSPYWIAILGTQGGVAQFRDGSSGCSSETSQQTNLTTLPQSWTSGTVYSSCPVSAFAGSIGCGMGGEVAVLLPPLLMLRRWRRRRL
jgi:hypothetical protein